MSSHTRIVLVGGGSGGHFYPLMSVARELRDTSNPPELYYIGPDPYNLEELQKLSISFIACPAGKLRRYTSVLNFVDAFRTFWGSLVAFLRLYFLYPDVIISKGSYTSVPVILAAAFLKIPIIVHESDTRPGKANALAARFARYVAISFEDVRSYFKNEHIEFTGIPMRRELTTPKQHDAKELLGLDPDTPIILILGGSQGAERINQLILDSLDELLPSYTIIHQTGKAHFDIAVLGARELITNDTLLRRYRPVAFFEDPVVLNDVYHSASVIVSRAGSTSIYEIAAHGKPSILIPIPETISHDQRTNAYAYARTGAASVLEEANLTDNLLTSEIDRIMKNADLLRSMAESATAFVPKNGAKAIANMAMEIAAEHT
jgi:UDP-N-acetylglucosamine--N-acetylmuramyl-(pentapeptide) pyrophosphoryl-undecaprenol N-acetylglucosamine transferase